MIPTRERPDTLAKCLRTVLNQTYENLRVIVSDNNSAPATAEVVRSFGDPRVTYLNTGRRISMSHNFEFALSEVNEGWIVLLGDDDGLLPDSLHAPVALLEETGLEALAAENCTFTWPSRRGAPDYSLTVPYGQSHSILNSADALAKLMDWRMHSLLLPQLYTGGMISAGLYQRIRTIKGSFFQSQIPDVYSGIAIASATDRFVLTRRPFAIGGTSGHSNGAALYRLQKTAFLQEGNIPFHEKIPLPETGTLTFSLPAMVYECYLQAEYLHQDRLCVSPADQLELIVNQTRQGREVLLEWSKQFAAMHGLDQSDAIRRAQSEHPGRRLSRMRGALRNIHSRYRVQADTGMQINDIFEASLVADAVLKTRPSRLSSYFRTSKRILRSAVAI